MRARRRQYFAIFVGILLAGLLAVLVVVVVSNQGGKKKPPIAGATAVPGRPAPFMHRPFYGDLSVAQRTVSFVDHDKPWYVDDKIFVRYDGKRWDNTPIGGCTGGVNCYDGHNGYDLNLWFEPVLSAAAGKVTRAGWYNPLNHNDALGLWVAIDHGNGITTAYGHLSAIMVAIGDSVGTQWQIGTSGTTGSSTGPHLHMATYYLPYWQATDPFGWTGNYADPNVVPDYNLWVANPGTGGAIPYLGGSAAYRGAVVVDDGDAGWSSTGNWASATAKTDVGGDLHWTSTTDGSATATATWRPNLPGDGYYEIAAYVDDNHASSSWAPYTVYSADPTQNGVEVQHAVFIDQSHIGLFQSPFGTVNTGPQWVSLGTYYFRKGMNSRVVLSNATGEKNAQLAADAVEFVAANIAGQPVTPSYRFAVTSDNTPSSLPPGTTANINLSVKNTGSATWSASGDTKVTLGYHWQDSAGHTLAAGIVDSSNISSLPTDVQPGGSVTIPLSLHTPVLAGNYQLVYDLQYQGKWFSSLGTASGSTTKTLSILPGLPRTYYFAEGYTGSGTSETLALTNLSAAQATITITYYYPNAAPLTRTYQVAAQSHRVLNINQEVGTGKSVGMVVQGNQPFVAERTDQTQAGSQVAITDSLGASTLSRSWYFAEGNTTPGWTTLLSALNPSTQAVRLTVTYQLLQTSPAQAARYTRTYTLPARTRSTLALNRDIPNQQFGMAISATAGVVVERVEYLVNSPMRGGSAIVGAAAPQKNWYFGAGDTMPGFTEVLALSNPAAGAATAQIRYLTTTGQTIMQNVSIPGQCSIQVRVNNIVKQALHATIVSASIPIVAERQDFFSTNMTGTNANVNGVSTNLKGALAGSMASMGSASTARSWYLSQEDTSAGHLPSLALTNPNATAAQVQIVYYRASGVPLVKSYTLTAGTRQTISPAADVGANQSTGVAIYATQPVIVEQAMFFLLQGASGGYAVAAYGT